jgi:hypothetical protein
MTPLFVLAALVAAAFAVLFFQANTAKTEIKAQLEGEKSGQDRLRTELADARAETAKIRARLDAKDKEVLEVRESSKKTKAKAANRAKETEALAGRVAELASAQSSYAGLDEARAEALEAKAAAANLRKRVEQLEAELAGGRKAAPRPVEVAASVDAPQPAPRPVRASDAADVADERAKAREMINALRASFDEQVHDERERARNEIDSLRRRLKKALNDIDRERGRADNNDKAYAIVKGQLEATLDRLAEFDNGIRRPVVVPQQRPRRTEPTADETSAAPVAEAPAAKKEKAAKPAPAVEVAAPVAEVAAPVAEAAAPAVEEPVAAAPVEEAPAAEEPVAAAPVVETPAAEEPVAAAPPVAETPAPQVESYSTAPIRRPMAPDLASLDAGWDLDDKVIGKLTGDHKTVE